ncbi:hypothetical protein SAMN04487958_1092 [Vreelandella subterranea]|uniref:Transposase DDE domain-containing protein n=1 Tax=Vreelandella subterranea TaxID=416874 RepID=A0A1H9VCY7_9GAMM|nr:hypothetical protein SAMN04487958_1092 [Halomonas subterranea]
MRGFERVMLLCERKIQYLTRFGWALKWLNANISMTQPGGWLSQKIRTPGDRSARNRVFYSLVRA